MPASQLSFQGINRSVSDYSSTGACEELINLRPTTAGLEPVKPFSVQMDAVSYDRVYEHKASTGTYYIGLSLSNNLLSAYQISADGTQVLSTLFQGVACSSLDYVHFASAGNILLFSVSDPDNPSYVNKVFIWNGSAYDQQDVQGPPVNASISDYSPTLKTRSVPGLSWSSISKESTAVEYAQSNLNAIIEENKDICFGPIIVAIALKTKDGEILWTDKWFVFDPAPDIKEATNLRLPDSNDSFYDGGDYCVFSMGNSSTTGTFALAGQPVGILFSRITQVSAWESSIVKSFEVYASRPKMYIDFDGFNTDSYLTYNEIIFSEKNLNQNSLGDELLYHMGSVAVDDVMQDDVRLPLTFGGNIQTASETLEVDSGPMQRFGDVLSYNARFHFFNSNAQYRLDIPEYTEDGAATSYKGWYPFIRVSNGGEEQLYYLNYQSSILSLPYNASRDYYYPRIVSIISHFRNVTEVIFYRRTSSQNTPWIVRYGMTPSSRYNYSIYDRGTNHGTTGTEDEAAELEALIPGGKKDNYSFIEPMAINVSEQYNPFVFEVEHSYLAPGKVLGLYPQMVAVSDVSYGDYPLNVFTDRGTYALLQGNGAVLYGAFRPISNLISISNGIPTESGTFFLAAGGLWLIAGSRAVLISDALSRGPHKYIRSCQGYQRIANTHYDVSQLESDPTFEEYTQEAKLIYNRFRDELIISNAKYFYSYVLSLKYRQWFKVGYHLAQDEMGGIARTTQLGQSVTFVIPSTPSGSAILLTTVLSGGQIRNIGHAVTDEEVNNRLLLAYNLAQEWNADSGFGDYVVATHQLGTDVTLTLTVVQGYYKPIVKAILDIDTLDTWEYPFEMPKVVSFADEVEGTDVLVHLQSRPFSYGYQYSHVHRLVSMIRANLSSNDHLFVALYGSDNLQDWSLLSYADRTNTKVSQIRTAPSARSWRYYTITIGGTAPQETDFGPTIIDYEPVIRRIG